MNPLEYAIEEEVDYKIVRELQAIAEVTHKRKAMSKKSLSGKKLMPNAA